MPKAMKGGKSKPSASKGTTKMPSCFHGKKAGMKRGY